MLHKPVSDDADRLESSQGADGSRPKVLQPARFDWAASFGGLRFQYLGALLIGIALPTALRWGGDIDGWLLPLQINTAIASSVAILLGLLGLRQIEAFPGARGSYLLVPVMLASFAMTLVVLLFGRVEYNRYLFPSSFVLSVVWIFIAQSISARRRVPTFAVVPGGRADDLREIDVAKWQLLNHPGLPAMRLTGVVADLELDLPSEWERFIADCALSGVRVFHVKQVKEALTGRVEIEHLSENTFGSLNPDAFYLKVKQAIDWVAALVVLVLGAPVLLAIALCIRLDSPGPVLFTQKRIGFRGRPFTVYKFRTMVVGADRAGEQLHAAMTQPDDPRITRVGRLLRHTRLDELAQIINILRGEMSWIGPRPEAEALSAWYEKELPFYRYRHIVRPGISGWAQVNQGHVHQVDAVLEKLHYDFYYIKRFSPWLDALILLRTVKTVLTGFGAR